MPLTDRQVRQEENDPLWATERGTEMLQVTMGLGSALRSEGACSVSSRPRGSPGVPWGWAWVCTEGEVALRAGGERWLQSEGRSSLLPGTERSVEAQHLSVPPSAGNRSR